jgi:hypothetical protein
MGKSTACALTRRHEASRFSRCSTPIPAAIQPSAMPTAGRCDTPNGPGRSSRGQDGTRSNSRCTHPATRHPFPFIGPCSLRRHDHAVRERRLYPGRHAVWYRYKPHVTDRQCFPVTSNAPSKATGQWHRPARFLDLGQNLWSHGSRSRRSGLRFTNRIGSDLMHLLERQQACGDQLGMKLPSAPLERCADLGAVPYVCGYG